MVVTVKWMREHYDRFNRDVFGGRLPADIDLKTGMSRDRWGSATFAYNKNTNEASHYTITMSNYYDSPYVVKCSTLLHEMIHVYDYVVCLRDHYFTKDGRQIGGYNSHGEWFQAMAARVKEKSGHDVYTGVTRADVMASDYSEATKAKLRRKAANGYNIAFVYPSVTCYGAERCWMMKLGEGDLAQAYKMMTDERSAWRTEIDHVTVYRCKSMAYADVGCSLDRSIKFVEQFKEVAEIVRENNMELRTVITHGGYEREYTSLVG